MTDKPSSGSTALKPSATKAKPPPMFQVVMYNDDYTPMEFVVEVLQLFFTLPRERATQVMLEKLEAIRIKAAECGVDRIFMGTDYPYPWTSTSVDHILTAPGFSNADRIAMLGGNASKIFSI